MKNLTLSILIFFTTAFLCISWSFCKGNYLTDPELNDLKNKKAYTDKYIEHHSKALLVLVKVPRKKELIKVEGDKWPDEIEYTINILKNPSGKVIFVAQLIDSESGDWSITYKYYFDEQGKVFAFNKGELVFNDNVKGGQVMSEQASYYNVDLKILGQINNLTDKDGKPIKGSESEYDLPEYKYTIYKNVNECLAAYNVPSH